MSKNVKVSWKYGKYVVKGGNCWTRMFYRCNYVGLFVSFLPTKFHVLIYLCRIVGVSLLAMRQESLKRSVVCKYSIMIGPKRHTHLADPLQPISAPALGYTWIYLLAQRCRDDPGFTKVLIP